MGERDLLFLGHMLDTAKGAIARVAEKGRETFDEDEDFRLSLAYRVRTIGEAARRVSEVTRETHPEIPWKQIVGMRHKIVHDYLNVDFEIVWQVATGISTTLDQVFANFLRRGRSRRRRPIVVRSVVVRQCM